LQEKSAFGARHPAARKSVFTLTGLWQVGQKPLQQEEGLQNFSLRDEEREMKKINWALGVVLLGRIEGVKSACALRQL
jgi:hypothetical protein